MVEYVRTTVDGPIGTVTIDRPDKLNALNTQINGSLYEAFTDLEDASVTAVVLRSTGDRAFVAGADLGEYAELSCEEFVSFQRNGRRTNDAIADHSAHVIAAVDGLAYGGGFELALAADMVVAEPGATFAVPEVTLGLLPAGGATQRLPRIVGTNKAKELLTTGEPIDATEAKSLGLVNRITDEGESDEVARDLAEKITSNAPIAVREAKRVVDEGIQAPLETGLSYEQEVTCRLFGTADAQEGIEAFMEDRNPEFEGH